MIKPMIAISLFLCYVAYSGMVYTGGTSHAVMPAPAVSGKVQEGKRIYQELNCAACHQVYGLGGYLGPDLTNAYSDPKRGEAYMRALLKAGGNRMPDFKLRDEQVDALIQYLNYVDATTNNNGRTGN